MTAVCLISVICHDRAGLVADISGHLFDLNANLSDTTFAVLGDMAEFTCIAEIPDDVPTQKVQRDLETVEGVAEGRVTVATFDMRAVHDESGHITHRIELDGPDAPGLILRIAEVFGSFGANIVRMNSERIPAPGHDRYVTRFAVHIPDHRVDACLATVANTAGEMRLSWRVSGVENGGRETRLAS
ncbi:MAG: amino acid-binding protein [bacterium]|nr:amino acid-binding protein [bacterium]